MIRIVCCLFLLLFGASTSQAKQKPAYRLLVRGSISKIAIKRVVQRHRKSIQYCFNQALTRNPAAFGQVLFSWLIDFRGRVIRVRILRRSYPDSLALRCIKRKILRWRFPRPRGGGIVLVHYPFQVVRGNHRHKYNHLRFPSPRSKRRKAPTTTRRYTGFISKANIRRVVFAYRKRIKACYRKSLVISPKLHGKLVMQWVIRPNGDTTSVSIVKNSMQNPEVGRCLLREIQTWAFPKPRGGGYVKIRYPFLFQRR